ncbi:MAG: molybdopterin-dependent oxidoreductase [Planctomycetota bacterium]|nr:molybdopterin-dependent oxidoreductase [Planctomycetota bacterium]
MTETPHLLLAGALQAGDLRLAAAEMAALPAAAQVPDVGALVPGRKGRGVRLSALLERARPTPAARYLNIESRDPSFAVSVPLDEVRAVAIVVYELAGAPLAPAQGGPFRLLVCGHPDECLNVKELARLELSPTPGRDTRPKDDAEHAALHRKNKH